MQRVLREDEMNSMKIEDIKKIVINFSKHYHQHNPSDPNLIKYYTNYWYWRNNESEDETDEELFLKYNGFHKNKNPINYNNPNIHKFYVNIKNNENN